MNRLPGEREHILEDSGARLHNLCARRGSGWLGDSWPPTIANKLDKMFDIFIKKTPAIKTLLVKQEHATLGAPGS